MNAGVRLSRRCQTAALEVLNKLKLCGSQTKICAIETFYLQTFVPSGGQSLHQSTDLTPFLFSFQIHYLQIYFYVECLGVLHCIMSSLFSFSVLHACFYYFICAYHFHFTSAWLFATNLSCQHLDFSMSELQLQLCLDWDQHDWPSIKSVSEHYLVCPMHNMTVIIVLDKYA